MKAHTAEHIGRVVLIGIIIPWFGWQPIDEVTNWPIYACEWLFAASVYYLGGHIGRAIHTFSVYP